MSRIYRPRGPVVTHEAPPLPSADLLREVRDIERRRVLLDIRDAVDRIPVYRPYSSRSYGTEARSAEEFKADALAALRRLDEAGERAMTWPTEQARRAEAEPTRLRIDGTWLVHEVDEHTCGTGSGGYYGLHEPGCGLIPEVDLSTLPGWAALVRAERAAAWEEGYDVGHRYARRVLPPDESDANPYTEEAPDA